MMPGKWSVKELFMMQSEKVNKGQISKTLYEQVTIERNKPQEDDFTTAKDDIDTSKRS